MESGWGEASIHSRPLFVAPPVFWSMDVVRDRTRAWQLTDLLYFRSPAVSSALAGPVHDPHRDIREKPAFPAKDTSSKSERVASKFAMPTKTGGVTLNKRSINFVAFTARIFRQ